MKIRVAIVFTLLLAACFVQAKGPPTKITIAGPGLDGVLEVTDPNLVDGLGLGAMENPRTIRGSQPPDVRGEGYVIERFYCAESGSCRAFDRLHYYLNLTGDTDHIFYDGLLDGSSEYDGRWFEVTVEAQKRMRGLLDHYSAAKPYLVLGNGNGQIQIRDAQTLKLLAAISLDLRNLYFWNIESKVMGRSLRFTTNNGDYRMNYALDLTEGALCRLGVPLDSVDGSTFYPSPDGRWVYGIRHGVEALLLDFYQVGTGEYRDLFSGGLDEWAGARGIWDTDSTRFYLLGSKAWAAFNPNIRSPVATHPLKLPTAEWNWYDIAAVQGDRLFIYHPLGRYWIYDYEADKRGDIPHGIFALDTRTGELAARWAEDISPAQVIPGGDRLYIVQAKLDTDTTQLFALDTKTGEVSASAELGAGLWFAAYTSLDAAALRLVGAARPCPHQQPALPQRPPVMVPPTALPGGGS
jgi:hypothetical protein